jgi:hypothetical protein
MQVIAEGQSVIDREEVDLDATLAVGSICLEGLGSLCSDRLRKVLEKRMVSRADREPITVAH